MAQNPLTDRSILGPYAESSLEAGGAFDTSGSSPLADRSILGPYAEGVATPQEPGVAGLPTIQDVSELPEDLLERTIQHAREGGQHILSGVSSLVPGTPETIWRRRAPDETAIQYLASKLAPL